MPRLTVFTPTYNRENTLGRVFDSLCQQTYRDFEWIIVDDGSTDHTKQLVERFQLESPFIVRYFYQENAGKHVAINHALREVDSELFLIADSDDSFRPDALQVFVDTWDGISDKEKAQYKGVIAMCYDARTCDPIGRFPEHLFDSNDLDAFFKLRLCFEKWSLVRTDVMREIPFPEPDEKLKFYPETVVWWRMARKYKTRYVDAPLRAYYRDQDNSLINQSGGRARETIYLWRAYINETMDYFWKYPKAFLKAYVGYARDNILAERSRREAMLSIRGFGRRFLATIAYPFGHYFAWKKRRASKPRQGRITTD